MKRSHRELSIDRVIPMGIFKNNQNYAHPLFYLYTLNRDQFTL